MARLIGGNASAPDASSASSNQNQQGESTQSQENSIITTRPLFGGAIAAQLPARYADASDWRQIPDHQEVWVENQHLPNHEVTSHGNENSCSVIVELLEMTAYDVDHGEPARSGLKFYSSAWLPGLTY